MIHRCMICPDLVRGRHVLDPAGINTGACTMQLQMTRRAFQVWPFRDEPIDVLQAYSEVLRTHPPGGGRVEVGRRSVVVIVASGRSYCQNGGSRAGSMVVQGDALARCHVLLNGPWAGLASQPPQPTKTRKRISRQNRQKMARHEARGQPFAGRGSRQSGSVSSKGGVPMQGNPSASMRKSAALHDRNNSVT